MTHLEYQTILAKKHGMTVAAVQEADMDFLQCEGYADDGTEYQTLEAWLNRKATKQKHDLIDDFDTPGAE
jgi:hypothetical protein